MGNTVLLIDDQWLMQELARISLQTAGYRVLLADDALTGLRMARNAHPDVTIYDTQPMDGDGMNFLNKLRGNPKTAEMSVLLIIEQPINAELEEALHKGVAGYLQKPFRPPELLSMIDRLLHHEEMPLAV